MNNSKTINKKTSRLAVIWRYFGNAILDGTQDENKTESICEHV